MRDRFGIFCAVIRIRKLSLLLVMTLRIPNTQQVRRWWEWCGAREKGRGRGRARGSRRTREQTREEQARAPYLRRRKGRRRQRSMRSGIDELDTGRFSPMRIRPRLGASCRASTSFRDKETVSLFFLLSLHLFQCHVSKMMR